VQAREQQRQSNSSSISSGVDPRSRNLENTENRLSKKRTKRKGKRKKKEREEERRAKTRGYFSE
jgi:hypothetical protein